MCARPRVVREVDGGARKGGDIETLSTDIVRNTQALLPIK
jgi:hypothetical protein